MDIIVQPYKKMSKMKIVVVKCGKMTATREMDANGSISVSGRTAQKRWSDITFNDITELPLCDVMLLRDRKDDEPLPDHLQALVNEIWQEVAEDEPWFAFCAPNFANAEL